MHISGILEVQNKRSLKKVLTWILVIFEISGGESVGKSGMDMLPYLRQQNKNESTEGHKNFCVYGK